MLSIKIEKSSASLYGNFTVEKAQSWFGLKHNKDTGARTNSYL